MQKPIHVLFVCLGNICRSPMAEAIFRGLVAKNGLQDFFEIDSAGTSNSHQGEDYHPQTLRVCAQKKVPAQGKSRPVRSKDFEYYDYILVMDEHNYRTMQKLDSQGYAKLKMFYFRFFSNQSNRTNMNVPDPYYGDAEDFDILFDLLSDCAEGLLKKIKADHSL